MIQVMKNELTPFQRDYFAEFGEMGKSIVERIAKGTPAAAWPRNPEEHLAQIRNWEENVKCAQEFTTKDISIKLADELRCKSIAENTRRWVSSRRVMIALQALGYEYPEME